MANSTPIMRGFVFKYPNTGRLVPVLAILLGAGCSQDHNPGVGTSKPVAAVARTAAAVVEKSGRGTCPHAGGVLQMAVGD